MLVPRFHFVMLTEEGSLTGRISTCFTICKQWNHLRRICQTNSTGLDDRECVLSHQCRYQSDGRHTRLDRARSIFTDRGEFRAGKSAREFEFFLSSPRWETIRKTLGDNDKRQKRTAEWEKGNKEGRGGKKGNRNQNKINGKGKGTRCCWKELRRRKEQSGHKVSCKLFGTTEETLFGRQTAGAQAICNPFAHSRRTPRRLLRFWRPKLCWQKSERRGPWKGGKVTMAWLVNAPETYEHNVLLVGGRNLAR